MLQDGCCMIGIAESEARQSRRQIAPRVVRENTGLREGGSSAGADPDAEVRTNAEFAYLCYRAGFTGSE